jgi:hypothetical protein
MSIIVPSFLQTVTWGGLGKGLGTYEFLGIGEAVEFLELSFLLVVVSSSDKDADGNSEENGESLDPG